MSVPNECRSLMECNIFIYATVFCSDFRATITVAVIGYREQTFAVPYRFIFLNNPYRDIQQLLVYRSAGLLPVGSNPFRTVRTGDNLLFGKVLNIDVGQSRKRSENEQVSDDFQSPVIEFIVNHQLEFVLHKISTFLTFLAKMVVRKRIGRDYPAVVGFGYYYPQRNAVQPYR